MKIFLILSIFTIHSLACRSIQPIAIPWKSVPTQEGSNSRGIPLNAGVNQELGLRISTMFSVTRVHSTVVCEGNGDKVYQRACEGQAGSTLDVTAPDFNQSFPVPFNFTMDPNDLFIQGELGEYQDEGHIPVILNTATKALTLGEYSLAIMTLVLPNIQRKSGVGMGRWSTFLNALYDLGHVPSKVWVLSQGSYSDANLFDGELVVGGYNPNAISGPFRNFTISDVNAEADGRKGLHCPLQVLVSDLSISIQGSTTSLMPDAAKDFKISACIDPFQQSMTLPVSMMARFLDLTGAVIPPPDGAESPKPLIFTTSDRKIENVTITILDGSNAFTVTIPGNETMNPVYGKLPDGKNGFIEGNFTQLEFRNQSDNYPVVDGYLPPMILGGTFLSQMYLMVDYSRDTFSLAPSAYHQGVSDGSNLYTMCDFEATNSRSLENYNKLRIGLAVLAAVGWLMAVILFCIILRSRRKRPEIGRERGLLESFGSYVPTSIVGRHLGSISDPPVPPAALGIARADTETTTTRGYTETQRGRLA